MNIAPHELDVTLVGEELGAVLVLASDSRLTGATSLYGTFLTGWCCLLGSSTLCGTGEIGATRLTGSTCFHPSLSGTILSAFWNRVSGIWNISLRE